MCNHKGEFLHHCEQHYLCYTTNALSPPSYYGMNHGLFPTMQHCYHPFLFFICQWDVHLWYQDVGFYLFVYQVCRFSLSLSEFCFLSSYLLSSLESRICLLVFFLGTFFTDSFKSEFSALLSPHKSRLCFLSLTTSEWPILWSLTYQIPPLHSDSCYWFLLLLHLDWLIHSVAHCSHSHSVWHQT